MVECVLNTPLTLQEILEGQRGDSEQILNRPTANFYRSGDIKEIAAELQSFF